MAVTNSSGATLETFSYDALGRRVTENTGTQTDLYFDASGNVLEERVGGSSLARTQYVWNPLAANTLVERDRDTTGNGVLNERLYVQQDANSNVTAFGGRPSGTVVERYLYNPFGTVTVLTPAWDVRGSSAYAMNYLFQGGRYDDAIGDYRFGAREYRPSIQVWTSQDPLGFAAGQNSFYAFDGNNATTQNDPTGPSDFWGNVGSFASGVGQGVWGAVKGIPGGIKETGLILFDGGRLIGGKLPTMATNAVFGGGVYEPTLYSNYAGGAIQARQEGRAFDYFTDAAANTITFGAKGVTEKIVGGAKTGDWNAVGQGVGQGTFTAASFYFTNKAGKAAPDPTRPALDKCFARGVVAEA